MKWACNIDKRGQIVRFFGGFLFCGLGAGIIENAVNADTTWLLVLGVLVLIGGAFTMFEGATGWCAVRAMGIKTPM